MVESKLDSFIRSAEVVISRCGGVRTNGEVSSIRTQEYSLQVIRETCRRLHSLGFYLADVSGLTRKHIDAVIAAWHRQGLSNKTIQNQFSRIKIFAGWLGKPWLVSEDGASGHLPGVDSKSLRVRTVADASKSWTANGVDLADVIKRATMEDIRLGAMLTLGIAFGLRKKEMLRIKPWRADKGTSLEIDGSVAKNGRYRNMLETGGYIQRLGARGLPEETAADLIQGAATPTDVQRLDLLYKHMIGAARQHLGVKGVFFHLKVEKAATLEDYRVLVDPLGNAIAKAKGMDTANAFLKVARSLTDD